MLRCIISKLRQQCASTAPSLLRIMSHCFMRERQRERAHARKQASEREGEGERKREGERERESARERARKRDIAGCISRHVTLHATWFVKSARSHCMMCINLAIPQFIARCTSDLHIPARGEPGSIAGPVRQFGVQSSENQLDWAS